LYPSIGVEAIVENLSHQLESSTPAEPCTKPEDPAVVKLAALRKQLLVQMTSQLHKVEEAGGMKNICFFQVISLHLYNIHVYIVWAQNFVELAFSTSGCIFPCIYIK
jgi:hypothetical protein